MYFVIGWSEWMEALCTSIDAVMQATTNTQNIIVKKNFSILFLNMATLCSPLPATALCFYDVLLAIMFYVVIEYS